MTSMHVRFLAAAAGALVLLAAAGMAFRPRAARAEPPSAPPKTAVEPCPVIPSPVIASDPEEATARLLAVRALDLFAQGAGSGAMAVSLESEARDLAWTLTARLGQSPRLWPCVLDVLCSIDDPRAATSLLAMISDALDETVERSFIDLLRSGETFQSRHVAVAALSRCTSTASLDALISAAQSDLDPRVRLDALKVLSLRKSGASPDSALAIDGLYQRSGRGEAHPEVRNAALRLSGQRIPEDDPRPAPARRATFGRSSKPRPAAPAQNP
jgi:hypothetical protein